MRGPSSGHHCELDAGWGPTSTSDSRYYEKTQVFEQTMVGLFVDRLTASTQPEPEPEKLSPIIARRHALALTCAERICANVCPMFEIIQGNNTQVTIAPRSTGYPPLRSV